MCNETLGINYAGTQKIIVMKNHTLFVLMFLQVTVFGQDVKVLTHRQHVKIVPVSMLNSAYRECNLSVSPDGRSLFFMSTRPSKINKIGGDGDLYMSTLNSKYEWDSPTYMRELNTTSGEDEPSLSADGTSIYFQSWNNTWINKNGPYYQAKIEKGTYKEPVGLGGGIAQFFREMYQMYSGFGTDGMAISSDGNLFIVACGPDYYGPMDLFYSIKKEGVWSYPKIMGVSTAGDERAVFIAADNNTIYFSSDGHGGFGGLDIFKTTIVDGKLGEILNLGAPFNTDADDQGFVITKNGNAAFLIRDLDIYFADLSQLSTEIKPSTAIIEESKPIVEEIIDQPIKIERIESKKASYVLNFDFDEFSLNLDAEKILNQIILDHQLGQKITLIGHTDNVGADAYNQNLSLQRVSTVESWLKNKGFENIDASGKGEHRPIINNTNELNKAKNRRVEIIIE